MAKKRYINTKFWDDPLVGKLSPDEKLVFIYLISNPLTDICGIYEIEERRIVFDTGLPQDRVSQAVDRLSQSGRILYTDGWMFIKNFYKHQTVNDSIIKGVVRSLNEIPRDVLAKFSQIDTGCHRLYTEWVQAATNLDLDLDLDFNLDRDLDSDLVAEESALEVIKPTKQPDDLMLDEKQHVKIIGLFGKFKNVTFENKEHVSEYIKRNAKAAKALVPYSSDKLHATMVYLSNKADYKWTLESVAKHIDDIDYMKKEVAKSNKRTINLDEYK